MSLLKWVEKFAYIAVAFGIIIFFYVIFKAWSEGQLHYFLFIGDFQSAAIVFGIVFLFGAIAKWLWKWEVRSLFGHKRERK